MPSQHLPPRPEGIMEEAIETGEHTTAEQFISSIPATIIHGYDPCYVPKSDEIRIPLRSDVETEERYYSVLFHELIHWTGAEGREYEQGFDPPPRKQRQILV